MSSSPPLGIEGWEKHDLDPDGVRSGVLRTKPFLHL